MGVTPLLTSVSTALMKTNYFWKRISCEKTHAKNDVMRQIGVRYCDVLIEQTCRAEQRVICPWKKHQNDHIWQRRQYLLMCKWSNRNVARRNKSLLVLEAWGKHGMLSYRLYRQCDGLTEAVCSNRMNNAFFFWFVFPLQSQHCDCNIMTCVFSTEIITLFNCVLKICRTIRCYGIGLLGIAYGRDQASELLTQSLHRGLLYPSHDCLQERLHLLKKISPNAPGPRVSGQVAQCDLTAFSEEGNVKWLMDGVNWSIWMGSGGALMWRGGKRWQPLWDGTHSVVSQAAGPALTGSVIVQFRLKTRRALTASLEGRGERGGVLQLHTQVIGCQHGARRSWRRDSLFKTHSFSSSSSSLFTSERNASNNSCCPASS